MVVGCWYGGKIAKRLDYNLAHGRSDIKLTEVCRKALKDFWVVRFCLPIKNWPSCATGLVAAGLAEGYHAGRSDEPSSE